MTAPTSAPRARDWWARPGLMLPLAGAAVVLVGLLKPVTDQGRAGDARLSSHLSGALGARALSDVAVRLGWRVQARDSAAVPSGVPGHTVQAVLANPVKLTPREAHAYLQAVRSGDGLLLAIGDRSPLSDSLGVWRLPIGTALTPAVADTLGCGRDRELIPTLWPDGQTHLQAVSWVRGRPPGAVALAVSDLTLRGNGGTKIRGTAASSLELAVGFPYGGGRVVVVGDADLLRNDVLRRCSWGASVAAVRMLEWLRAGGAQPRDLLAFDEYHQGFGPKPSMLAVAGRFLVQEPTGRTILQLLIASLVLLAALAPRALGPVHVERPERRDPLEQVDALAHAYEQVGASRTAVSRLLAGLRARRERAGGRQPLTDDAFLADVAHRLPSHGSDVALVRAALRDRVGDAELVEAAAALHRIEHSLTTTHS